MGNKSIFSHGEMTNRPRLLFLPGQSEGEPQHLIICTQDNREIFLPPETVLSFEDDSRLVFFVPSGVHMRDANGNSL